jgi:hypothetical protein
MTQFQVKIPIEAVITILVEADTEEEAKENVMGGEGDLVHHGEEVWDYDTNNWDVNKIS